MYDYSLHLQAKQKIEDMRRENERRHWLRDVMNAIQSDRSERAVRKTAPVRELGQHE